MSAVDARHEDDAPLRRRALDPDRSFIVEAPAGSGKTELLIQRYLKLLDRVEYPEQIVAITFTRKAAAEMRQRVLNALLAAADAPDSLPRHHKVTRDLAQAVLARSEALGWALLEQSQRLKIMTIDALNTGLAQQLPILADAVVGAELTDSPADAYDQAAARTAESLSEDNALGEGLRLLLGAADNSLARLQRWLADLLPRRDRWLRSLASGHGKGLAATVAANWEALRNLRRQQLALLAGRANEVRLTELLRGDEAAGDALSIEEWCKAARLLLTGKGDWRQRFTRREGIDPDDADRKAAIRDLIATFAAIDGLREALQHFLRFGTLHPDALARLDAIESVLPRLLAELRVWFSETGTVDHTELALAAQRALGAVDSPSELLLALDRRIEHILVDEFQDTSHLQWELLELLTAGWERGDGRTLFIVGDPMQSIYRFRDAELSLFLEARQRGIGGIALEAIQLHCNHRSQREIVDWVNSRFARIFPVGDGSTQEQVLFRPATTARAADGQAGVELHLLESGKPEAELDRIISIAANAARHRDQSIGILVRSRAHLKGLRAGLAAAGLAAHAVEIDSIIDTQTGQDLTALALALLHPGDRLAWLGVLRSPCVGFGWADLHALCAGHRERTIWDLLNDGSALARLSPSGRQRAAALSQQLATGFRLRARLPLGAWLRECWRLIDGPAGVTDVGDIRLAERFFAEIEGRSRRADLDDTAALREQLAAAPAGEEVPLEAGIEIMTIHRAKGLEFDTVILPGISKTTRGNDSNLLISMEFIDSEDFRRGLLAARVDDDPLYQFVRVHEREQAAAEDARLLYVAATRARRRLHLVGARDPDRDAPARGSLLATLWPAVDQDDLSTPSPAHGSVSQHDTSIGTPDDDHGPVTGISGDPASEFIDVPLRRLEMPAPTAGLHGAGAANDSALGEPAVTRPEFEWVRPASVQVGTLIHRELQRLAERGAATGQAVAPRGDPKRFERELALLGVEESDLGEAAVRVLTALERCWEDPVGRWILEPRAEAWSELRLTLKRQGRLEHVRLDRSFIDDAGCRWIIDYKTGRHLGTDVEAFLDAEVERYREQLERYARAMAAIDARPIRVGLYFPLLARLREWAPDLAAS